MLVDTRATRASDAEAARCNLAAIYVGLGQLRAAREILETADIRGTTRGRILGAVLDAIRGSFRSAGDLVEALRLEQARAPLPELAFQVEVVATIRALLQLSPHAAVIAGRAREYAVDAGSRAEDLLVGDLLQAAAELMSGAPAKEPDSLRSAREQIERTGLEGFRPALLLAEAAWFRAAADPPRAAASARAAAEAAQKCRRRLEFACAELLLGHLARDRGDRAAVRRHAMRAEKAARCDGPPDCFVPALLLAQRLLA